MTRTRARWFLAFVLLASLLCGCAVGLKAWRGAQVARQQTAQCAEVTSINAARRDIDPVTTGVPVAVVLGDSYAQGAYLDAPGRDAWSTRFGASQGWTTYVDAVGGTGFTSDGPCDGQQFGARIPAVLAHQPDVVVVQGGLNDTGVDAPQVHDAAVDLLAALSTVHRVIVVGPVDAPSRDGETQVDAALRSAAEQTGREFVSTLDWQLPFIDDGVHLTLSGHELFAQMLSVEVTG